MSGPRFYRLALDRAEWMAEAACRGADPELFFPSRGDPTREAKAICWSCRVREECLEYALANGEKHGLWGGMSERQRRSVRRDRRRSQRAS